MDGFGVHAWCLGPAQDRGDHVPDRNLPVFLLHNIIFLLLVFNQFIILHKHALHRLFYSIPVRQKCFLLFVKILCEKSLKNVDF